MKITQYESQHYRNLEPITFTPDAGMNLLYGDNGQGKTNILESLWLFTGCHSFRTNKINELIQQGKTQAQVSVGFYAQDREQTATIRLNKKREAILNGVMKESPRQLLGEFYAVVFSPDELRIIKDGPGERRRFLDIAISQIKPNYASVLSQYMKTLQQRNAVLRQIAQQGSAVAELEPWDLQLARLGARIIRYRREYIAHLQAQARDIYAGISGKREQLSIDYLCCVTQEGQDTAVLADILCEILCKSREVDIRRQHTTCGIHKEDLLLCVNERSARHYGSQGQQRSCALALKIAEATLLFHMTQERPVVLLDDVMSELDEKRQRDLLQYLQDWQVFVTCCEPSRMVREQSGKAFYIAAGGLREG